MALPCILSWRIHTRPHSGNYLMYRRVNSGRFIGLTTFLIVVVMAVFTWVMYGMAQRVFTMTDIIQELNESIKTMVGTQVSMAKDMHDMSTSMGTMNVNIANMNKSIGSMTTNVETMNQSIGTMNKTMVGLSGAVGNMAGNMNRMTYDIGKATYALSNPMSYMWGNAFPF